MADKDRAYLDSLTHAYNAIELRNEMGYWGPAFPMIKMTMPEQPIYSPLALEGDDMTARTEALALADRLEKRQKLPEYIRDEQCIHEAAAMLRKLAGGMEWREKLTHGIGNDPPAIVGEYNESYYVNFCPFCGFKARKQWPYKGVSK